MILFNKDFTYSYNTDGYMIQYKGHDIGGASVMLPRSKPLHWQHAKKNRIQFKENAEREIKHLINGYGQSRFITAIQRIDNKVM
jgi:hypothetical protein